MKICGSVGGVGGWERGGERGGEGGKKEGRQRGKGELGGRSVSQHACTCSP